MFIYNIFLIILNFFAFNLLFFVLNCSLFRLPFPNFHGFDASYFFFCLNSLDFKNLLVDQQAYFICLWEMVQRLTKLHFSFSANLVCTEPSHWIRVLLQCVFLLLLFSFPFFLYHMFLRATSSTLSLTLLFCAFRLSKHLIIREELTGCFFLCNFVMECFIECRLISYGIYYILPWMLLNYKNVDWF